MRPLLTTVCRLPREGFIFAKPSSLTSARCALARHRALALAYARAHVHARACHLQMTRSWVEGGAWDACVQARAAHCEHRLRVRLDVGGGSPSAAFLPSLVETMEIQ